MLVAFYGDKKYMCKKGLPDKNGWILRLDTKIDDSWYILINLNNSNTESELLNTLDEQLSLLNKLEL